MKDYHYDEENNFLWIDSVVGGTIPSNFMPAVEKGFRDRLERGVIAGYQVQNVCVEVHFGKHHPVDSSEQAFKTAASMAFRNVFQQAKPALLEPIVKMEITVPVGQRGRHQQRHVGPPRPRAGHGLGRRRPADRHAPRCPLAEVTTYARSLSSITGGQGSYTMEFSHYDVVPGNVQQEIIAKAAAEGRGRGVERFIVRNAGQGLAASATSPLGVRDLGRVRYAAQSRARWVEWEFTCSFISEVFHDYSL